MKILFVCATQNEIAPLLKHLTIKNQDGRLISGRYKKVNVDVLISGIGMVATAYGLAKVIGKGYDAAINLGIAGSFKHDLGIGSVVNVTQDRFSELGSESEEKFLTLEEISLIGTDVIKDLIHFKNRVIADMREARGITVNTVHGLQSSIDSIVRQFDPDVETMEGAAFLYVCKNEGMPCAQLRAVSNFVESRHIDLKDGMHVLGRNPSSLRLTWNIPLAIRNVNEIALRVLESYTKKASGKK